MGNKNASAEKAAALQRDPDALDELAAKVKEHDANFAIVVEAETLATRKGGGWGKPSEMDNKRKAISLYDKAGDSYRRVDQPQEAAAAFTRAAQICKLLGNNSDEHDAYMKAFACFPASGFADDKAAAFTARSSFCRSGMAALPACCRR